MAGKRDSRRHSTTRFSENVAWREQVIKCKTFHRFAIEEGLTSSSIINRTNFFGEKNKNEASKDVCFFRASAKTQVKCPTRTSSRPQI